MLLLLLFILLLLGEIQLIHGSKDIVILLYVKAKTILNVVIVHVAIYVSLLATSCVQTGLSILVLDFHITIFVAWAIQDNNIVATSMEIYFFKYARGKNPKNNAVSSALDQV